MLELQVTVGYVVKLDYQYPYVSNVYKQTQPLPL
jgi:hypothetical protein